MYKEITYKVGNDKCQEKKYAASEFRVKKDN